MCETFNSDADEDMRRFFTQDCELKASGEDMYKGQDGVQAFWRGARHMGLTLSMNVSHCDELCTECLVNGTFNFNSKFSEVDCGRFMAVCKREGDGQFKIQKCYLNSSRLELPTPEQQVYGANQAVMAAFARGDHAAIARNYTEDA
jgi:ketosteroid isomerase-like protein